MSGFGGGQLNVQAQARRRKEMLQKGNTREQELNYIQVQKQILREHSGEAPDEEERPKKKKMSLDDMVSKYEKKMSGEGEDEEPEPPPKPKKKLNLDALVANFEKKEEPPTRSSGQTGARSSYNNSSEWNNAKQRMEDKATKGEKQRMEEFIQARIQGQGETASPAAAHDDDKDKDAKLAEALADVAALKNRLAISESASSSANRPAGDPSNRLAQLISETHGRMQVIAGEKPRAEIWPEMAEASMEQSTQEKQTEEDPSADNMSAEIRRRLSIDDASQAKEKAHEDMAEEIKRRLEAHIRGHQDGGAPQVEETPLESEADVKKRLLQKRADKLKRNEKASSFARAPLEMPEEMRTRLLQEREMKAKLLQERAQAIKAKGPPAMPSMIQRRMDEQQQMQEMAESQAQWEIPQDRGLSLALPAGPQIAQSKAAGGCAPSGGAPYGNLKRKLSNLSEGSQGPELAQLAQGISLGSRPQSFADLAQFQSGELPPEGNFGGSSGYESAPPAGFGGGLGGFDGGLGGFDGGLGGFDAGFGGFDGGPPGLSSMLDAAPPASLPQFSMPPPLPIAPAVKKRKTPQEIIESMNKRIEAISYQTAAEEEEAAQEDANAAQLMGVTQQPAQPDYSMSEMAAQMAAMDPAMAAQMAAMEAQLSMMDPAMQAQLAAMDPAMQAQLAAQMAAQGAAQTAQTEADGHTFGADAFGLMFGAEGCADTSNFMQHPSMAFPVAQPLQRSSEEVWKPKTQVNIPKGGSKGGGSWTAPGAGAWQQKGAWQDTNKWNNKEEWKDSGWNEPGKWKDPKKEEKKDDWGAGKSWGSTDTWDPEDVWEGDWICPKCKILVFGWKDACGMCQTSKADGRPPEEFFPGIKINKRPAEEAPEDEEEFKPKAAKNSAGWAKLAMAMAQNLQAPEP